MRARCLLLLSCAILAVPVGRAASQSAAGAPVASADPKDVRSIDAIIAAVYDVISGPAGSARNWNRFRSLFADGARLIPTRVVPNGVAKLRMLSADEYATNAGPQLEASGFYEREIGRSADSFGSMAQVFSAYESKRAATDPRPFARGINSFQLFNDGTRWWIVTIYWDAERPDNPIPAKYLNKR